MVLPIVALLPFGVLWLWQHDRLIEWLLGLVVIGGIAFALLALLNRKRSIMQVDRSEVLADPKWPDGTLPAWSVVTDRATQLSLKDYPLDNSAKLLELGRQTIESVARHYHPESHNATLEIAIPYLLLIIERVSQDLRQLLDNIPFSHVLTINDLVRGRSLASFASKAYDVYRLGSVAVNPVGAMLRELRALTTHKILRYPTDELKLWLLQTYVKKIGYYAIEVYGGALTLNDLKTAEYVTRASRSDLEEGREDSAKEPLRLLVLGQVNAGKSSLINALFGEMRAVTDVLPLTSGVVPYVLERDGVGQMIILDTAGYGGSAAGLELKRTEAELLRVDMVLLVCAATSAARGADRQLLGRVTALFASRPETVAPPIIVIVTHIDQLRPVREWAPPYNVAQPQRAKEQAIVQAMEAIAKDLETIRSDMIPVCLQPGHLYNIEEGVVPAILERLPSTQRVRYLRCLREQRQEDYWKRLREQAIKAGRILLDASAQMATTTVETLGKRFQ